MTRLVVMGSSWGGVEAVGRVLANLPEGFYTPIAVAQHRSPDSDGESLVLELERAGGRRVREAEDKDAIVAGWVYLAPADYHLLVEDATFALSTDERVHYSRPSIDVLFESASDAYGEDVVGVILTGANDDGAAGISRIKERGGMAIIQDPLTAERREMPDAAIAATVADAILPLDDIGTLLGELGGRRVLAPNRGPP